MPNNRKIKKLRGKKAIPLRGHFIISNKKEAKRYGYPIGSWYFHGLERDL